MSPRRKDPELSLYGPIIPMHHYASRTSDGLYHVQNMLGPYAGQHHVHTEKGYREWSKKLNKRYLHIEDAESCPCGLKPGYVREHDGRVWFKKEFE
jgi:hypothetical protein